MEQHQYEELRNDIHEIKTALMGNPITKDGGIVNRLQHIEKTCEDLTKFKDKSKWTATILIGFAGVLVWVADKIFNLFTNTH